MVGVRLCRRLIGMLSQKTKDKTLKDISECYDEIYNLEVVRRELNKKISLKKKRLYALLNFIRMEVPYGKEKEASKEASGKKRK